MFNLGLGEILVICVVLIIVVGPERLPSLMKTMGKAVRTVREASREIQTTVGLDELMRDDVGYTPPQRPLGPPPALTVSREASTAPPEAPAEASTAEAPAAPPNATPAPGVAPAVARDTSAGRAAELTAAAAAMIAKHAPPVTPTAASNAAPAATLVRPAENASPSPPAAPTAEGGKGEA